MNNRKLVEVFPYSWEIFKYTMDGKEIVSEVIGSFTQFPFRLAWAVTIHKSQGKTFDHVTIDIGRGTFATGQLYVALSRCTSFEGLSLTKPIQKRHVMTDERIFSFLEQYLPQDLNELQKKKKLEKAIQEGQKLKIEYKKSNGEISLRLIFPKRLEQGKLLAICAQRNAPRYFNLDGIQKICEV